MEALEKYRTQTEIMEGDLRPLLTDEFLATLTQAVKTCGWTVDHCESSKFVRWCHQIADKPSPDLEPYDLE